MDNKETFKYTYSAKQQEEIKAIRKKYDAPQEDKMEQLRRLDGGVTGKASVCSIIVGIVGVLIMGFGMSLFMSELSEILGLYRDFAMVIGIVIGLIGIVLVCCAYPIYNHSVRKERKRIAPEILRLTDELLKQ
ncbi:MAG: hypothetical protein ACI4D4_00335 [Lachnospira sp.]